MLHQVGVSFYLYYDARKHKIKIKECIYLEFFIIQIVLYSRDMSVAKLRRQMSYMKRGKAHIMYSRGQCFCEIVLWFRV